jgi:hypothetical protein
MNTQHVSPRDAEDTLEASVDDDDPDERVYDHQSRRTGALAKLTSM